MWLHLPTTQSQYAVGIAVLTLGSERLSQLQQSAMWKSKFQQQQSWQRVWKRDTSIRRLSGLTLKPSILNRGVEKWISSLEGSLASPSQSQGRSSEKMTQETSGPTQPDLLGGLGFQSSFLKMCQESSDTTTTPYDPNYERWVTKLRKDYFQRQKQAHPTSANDSLSWDIANWPTPTTQETPHEDMELTETGRRKTKDGKDSHSLNLQDVSANWNKETTWPIPTVEEVDKIGNRPNYGQVALSNHPALVGYPEREKMGKSRKSDGNSTNPDIPSIHQDQETEKDGHSCSPSCRRLNPLFAEHLMGLPLGWTCVSEPLAMESYQQWQHSLGEYLARDL